MKLVDQMSGPMRVVQTQMAALQGTQTAATAVQQKYNDLVKGSTRNLSDMRTAVELLKADRELIPKTSIESIRAANREIRSLEGEIRKLESLNGGPLKKAGNLLVDLVPGAGALMNPIVALSAAGTAAGTAFMGFEKAMAEVNATAQLSGPGLDALSDQMKSLAIDKGIDLTKVTGGLNTMISITNDVELASNAMSTAADVAKAGFVELDVAANTVARTMAAAGSTDAARVADVLFATQREGAVSFAQLADALPRLIPTAKSLGFSLEETAGAFAFMTRKGLNAADSGTLLNNVFSAFSKPEIRTGLRQIGVELTNADGSTRSMIDVFTDLGEKMKSMSTDEQLNLLSGMDLNDAQAREGFRQLIGDTDLFRRIVGETTASQGALGDAMDKVHNASYDLIGAWSVFQVIMVDIGSVVLPPVVVILKGIAWVFEVLRKAIWGVVAFATVLTGVWALYNTEAALTAAANIWMAVTNWGIVASLRGVASALYNIPILGWILAAIAALIALWNTWDGFRYAIHGAFAVIKQVFWALYQIATLDFAGAAKSLENLGGAYEKGRNEAIAKDEAEKKKQEQAEGKGNTEPANKNAQTTPATAPAPNLPADMKSISDGVTGGGAKATNINIATLSILESFTLQVQTAAEGADRLQDMVAEAVLRGLNGAVLATGR